MKPGSSRFDPVLEGLESERDTPALMQTIPAFDQIGAAMLLVEIGADMDAFGSTRSFGFVGGRLPATMNRRAAQIRPHPQGQSPLCSPFAVAICPRSQPDHVDVQIEVPGPLWSGVATNERLYG